ncbi:MAG: aminopeptidase P family protein [Anaerolineae bacterium]|jgi:Xaa-Pro aminopeptidase|nr:aminopeptidase P family protein [Anaerolineae bacterium]MBT4312080.1 aminopeptidase P family protein [Anaerolineae bacterium]MBT4457131.1 aminopeptidase P family protein [Anaerolineae bacterium]MBT4843112.1 aminopeptidase P family protein [Anaerolineae bacterium]MBT6060980.1 aminopeptidase P family protein [Anaerolineae bacterium]
MKTDLDQIMQDRNIDALLVLGDAEHNAPMYYLTGGGHVNAATLIKPRGKDATLFCNDMEREEAKKTGLKTVTYSKYSLKELQKEAKGDLVLVSALRLEKMLNDCNVKSGRVGVYGHTDVSHTFAILTAVQKKMPAIEFVGETNMDSVFLQAMETKAEDEVERIRKMGQITTEVVGLVKDYLTGHAVDENEVLLRTDGKPLTISDVKAKINLWLAERGAENPEATIFAIGRDTGFPHSVGTPSNVIRLGKTIIFDIFPCEAGGGYFYDFTRTWCLGYAPEAEQKLYDDVREIYEKLMDEMEVNMPFGELQRITCELFEAQGHPTTRSNEATQEGYVHSVGHGLGVNVHERPWARMEMKDNLLQRGTVFTIEPGLYYPDRGMGVRIENTYYARPDGTFERLAEFDFGFVVEME